MAQKQQSGDRWQAKAKISEENETNEVEICKHTGSILRPSQPFPLWVALDTDDVEAVSLLQSKVCLTASAVHTSFPLVDGLQRAYQLTNHWIDYYIYLCSGFNRTRYLSLFVLEPNLKQ